jgi:hypothetical protein
MTLNQGILVSFTLIGEDSNSYENIPQVLVKIDDPNLDNYNRRPVLKTIDPSSDIY